MRCGWSGWSAGALGEQVRISDSEPSWYNQPRGWMMKQLIVQYPDDLAQAVQLTPSELAAQVRLMAALKMFELGKLSSGRAAELAGLSRVEFLEACSSYGVSPFN